MIWNKGLWEAMCRQNICCVPALAHCSHRAAAMQSQNGMCVHVRTARALRRVCFFRSMARLLFRLWRASFWAQA